MTMAQVSVKSCEICDQARYEHYCEDCEQFFCNSCKLLHLRSFISRNHTFNDNQPKPNLHSTGITQREEKSDIKKKIIKCSSHQEELIFYCEYCEEAACKLCITRNHRGHEMSDIAEVVTEMATASSHHVQQLAKEAEIARGYIHEYECHMGNFKCDIKECSCEIRKMGDFIKQLVDNAVESMLLNLKSCQQEELMRTSESINKLKHTIETFDKLKTKALNVSKDASALPVFREIWDTIETYSFPATEEHGHLHVNLNGVSQEDIECLFGCNIEYGV